MASDHEAQVQKIEDHVRAYVKPVEVVKVVGDPLQLPKFVALQEMDGVLIKFDPNVGQMQGLDGQSIATAGTPTLEVTVVDLRVTALRGLLELAASENIPVRYGDKEFVIIAWYQKTNGGSSPTTTFKMVERLASNLFGGSLGGLGGSLGGLGSLLGDMKLSEA